MADPTAPTVLIMAAGEGTRMRSSLPKVLHPVCGRPMLAWPALAARDAGAERICVIASPNRDLTPGMPDGAETVVQPEANGTGGAMLAALEAIRESERVLVLSGDTPLITAETLAGLLAAHGESGVAATVMTVAIDDPSGYGRIVRDDAGDVTEIVETKHPEGVSESVLAIDEINTATYVFEAAPFADALAGLRPENEAGEYFLTDVIALLRQAGHRVAAHIVDDPRVNLGVNTREDLARVSSEARTMILRRHMLAGVTITDPSSTWVDADVTIQPDVVLEPGTYLRGATFIASGAAVGPQTTLLDTSVGANASVVHTYAVEAEIGDRCSVGPFAYLRPGARLAAGAKVGTFVEVKNSELGEGAKVPHLSYIGDADIGAGANVGAGTITANYDGFSKNRTKIGKDARISVHTSLVAPVDVGDGAYTGAGAVIRDDVPPGALGVSKGEQRNIDGFAERKAAEHQTDPDEPEAEAEET